MKRNLRVLLLLAFMFIAPLIMFAQNPPHPNNGAAPNASGNTPVGGAAAPVGGGSLILVALAMAYGGSKIYSVRSEEEKD